MKLRDGVLLIVLVLLFVILAYLLSSKNPKKGLFAPILVPIRGWFGGHGHSGGNSVVVVGGAGGAGGGGGGGGSSGGGGGGGGSSGGGGGAGGNGDGDGDAGGDAPQLPGPIVIPGNVPLPPIQGPFSLMNN